MFQITTVTQKGQVTIPIPFRKQMGLVAGSKIRFAKVRNATNELLLSPVPDFSSFRGIVKSKQRYSKTAARKAYMKDVLTGKI